MLDNATAAFIQTGVSISLAACDARGVPTISRGLGCTLLDDGRVAVFVQGRQAAQLLANVRINGRIANAFNRPSDNRTVQFKGDDALIVPFDPVYQALIDQHLEEFLQELLPLGTPEPMVRALLDHSPDDLYTVVYTPRQLFSQTPGPKAGEPLAGQP